MSKPIRELIKIGTFILAFMVILAGLMLLRVDSLLLGTGLVIIGLVLFLVSSTLLHRNPPAAGTIQTIRPYRLLIICWCASILLTFWLLFRLVRTLDLAGPHTWNWVIWLCSLLLLVVGTLSVGGWPQQVRARWRAWARENSGEIKVVLVLFVVGLAFRIYALNLLPYPWSGDEASIGVEARRILNGEITEIFSTGWSSQPYWSFVPTSITLAVFGENIWGIRMTSALVGTLTILTLYLFCRELFSRRVATFAGIFMLAFPYHLQFSRIGVHNIFDGFNVTLALWLVYRAITRKKLLDFVLAGIVTGFSFYTYVGSRLVVAMSVGSLVYAALLQRDFLRQQVLKLGAFTLALITTLAPISYYFIRHPDNFMTRIGQEGILLNDWLSNEVVRTGTNTFGILLNQFSKSTLVFISDEAGGNFFNSPEPYLTLLGAVFFLIGLAYAFWRLKEIRFIILLGWFWSVILFGGILTTNPPANTRMIMTAPAIAAFLAIGLDQAGQALSRLHISRTSVNILSSVVLAVLFFQGWFFYFGEYWHGQYFQDGNSELGMEAGLQLRTLGPEYHYYLFGRPRVFVEFPTTVFVAPDNPKLDLTTDMIPQLQISRAQPSIFIAIPDNKSDLSQIEARFPGGEWQTVYRKTKPEVLYYAYIYQP